MVVGGIERALEVPMSLFAAIRPISYPGIRTVVRGGLTNAEKSKSLNPADRDVVGHLEAAHLELMHRSEGEQVVAAHDRGRRLGLIEQRFDERCAGCQVPDAIEPFETGSGGCPRR